MPARWKDAVVIGAGMAGLAVARVLAERFDRVLVLDRDELPDAPVPRRGTPQSFHGHVLLGAGLRMLEEIFPGLRAELVRAGATPFDPGSDLRYFQFGRLASRSPVGLTLVAMSRPLLELTVRRRVAALGNVTVRPGTAVAGLCGERGRVTGVRLDDGESLSAELVVDCSGRGSRCDRWVAALGFPVPETIEVKVGIGYGTRLYRREPGQLPDAVGVFVVPDAPRAKRVGLLLPLEDDRWLVSLGGWHGAHAPTDPAGFVASAQALPDPAIGVVAAEAEPLSDVLPYRFPTNRRRLFERLRATPAGYLAAGDAVCSFNPIYGQGMTCAVLEAVALGRTLDRHEDTSAALVRDFYRTMAKMVSVPWQFAVGADFAYPETTGPRPFGTSLMNAYTRRLQQVALSNPKVMRTFISVQHLLAPPRALFAPTMVATVLRGSR